MFANKDFSILKCKSTAVSMAVALLAAGCGGGELAASSAITAPQPSALSASLARTPQTSPRDANDTPADLAPTDSAIITYASKRSSAYSGAGVPCPANASFSTALGFCSDGINVYGPFTAAMTAKCISSGGGGACNATNPYTVAGATLMLQRWSFNFAKSMRGTGTCPAGSAVDAAVDSRCTETASGVKNVYAGFAPAIVTRCEELNGGSACYSTRWNANFYLKASFAYMLQNNLSAAWAGTGIPSVSVAVSTPDQGYVSASRGVASPTTAPIVPAESQYRFASVTKNLTAALILKLQEGGQLNIDDKLSAHLNVPGLAYASAITIRQLLNHSAGVGDHLDNSNSFNNSTSTWRLYANDEIVGYINGVGASFYPGGGYDYSNGGFYLLGMLIEKKLGVPLDTAFNTHLMTPLGLSKTFLDVASSPTARIPKLVESTRAYAYSMSSARGAGAVVSTTTDMAKYARAIFGGGFLSAASITAMQSSQTNSANYGLGTIRFLSPAGTRYYGHTGTILDYKSLVYFIPSMNVSVALTMNSVPSEATLANIKAAVLQTVESRY